MRLIDADEFYNRIENDTDLCAEMELDGLKALKKYLDLQPTAYSVEKVVEELEEYLKSERNFNDIIDTGSEIKNPVLTRTIGRIEAFEKSIEIVKQCCVGTESESIRDKAVKWNNNSSKRVPYEFIDYVEGKRDICISDDVCEWKDNYSNNQYSYLTSCDKIFEFDSDYNFCPYCGKKIKVVE